MLLGDVVVCPSVATRQAAERNVTAEDELALLVVHGVLHLLDYDHAETSEAIYMLEPKRRTEMDDPEVLAKRDMAVAWCRRATEHAAKNHGKPWTYALIPHDAIASNMTLPGLVERWSVQP